MFDFGLNLVKLRKEAKYTQQQFADILKVSTHTVKFWELNYCFPSFEHLVAIAKLHGVTLDYLVGFDKRRKIVLDYMSDSQKELMRSVKEEMVSNRRREKGTVLTDQEVEIISLIEQELK